MLAWLRSLAEAILGKTGKPDHLDTATRMAMGRDFSATWETTSPARRDPQEPPVDPIDELKRLIADQEKNSPRRARAPPPSGRRRHPKGRR